MSPILNDLRWCISRARAPRLRTMRQFAEAEIVIPDGPFEGRRFRCDRQPYTALWLDAVDSGKWSRFVATGPTQSGKTLSCFVLPLLYHLLEIGETVICGLPDMDMAGDKWREDILPVIEQSRYRDLLPRKGGGSRGGRVDAMQLRNGATLKFMSGGGNDKSRAGFTSRVVVITETDGLDRPGAASRESDKVTQLEARTRAYGSRKRIYMECTVSTEEGRTWQEFESGTHSRIALPCPHCGNFVTPEREHLIGWQAADTQTMAKNQARFVCPQCSEPWTDDQRREANVRGRLLHGDQSVNEAGAVTGSDPETDTLGFRWSAVHNLFLGAGDVAADEWRASRATEEELAEREMRQFVWCIPVEATKWNQTPLAVTELAARHGSWAKGIIPADARFLTAAIDIGKYLTHWALIAWREGATGHLVDYGRLEVPSQDLGVEQAVMVTLRQFRDLVTNGWPKLGTDKPMIPDQVWVDAGYQTDVVYAFVRESGNRFRPAVGRGAAQQRRQNYNQPTQATNTVHHIGEGFHLAVQQAAGVYLVEANADHWKTWVHARLSTPLTSPGALTFYQAGPHEHLALARHLTAETKVEEFIAGQGVVTRWERIRKDNHWLDAIYNACAAGYLAGARLIAEQLPEQSRRSAVISSGHTRRDGSPWIDLSRWRGIRGS
ncbi:Phage terminase large subunit (GpA) [Anatilimnocola aggregata]|uniref:Phage terminase large subunit (GpA) n=1 Tax=Anatilimnocola aggregata TaxID=2528021 RepID=A0A517YE60_9BACT|nr:terminase gpA endonuclease subunit [Anatilimnocola aggregata]QDU28516.1 Phage terminase large subunit (GpA) [Anatilimnocola aggregata]